MILRLFDAHGQTTPGDRQELPDDPLPRVGEWIRHAASGLTGTARLYRVSAVEHAISKGQRVIFVTAYEATARDYHAARLTADGPRAVRETE